MATLNALAPPRRQALNHRMTELAAQRIRRPTSLRDKPVFSNAKARRRRSSSRSALPFGLGIGVVFPQHLLLHYLCRCQYFHAVRLAAVRERRARALPAAAGPGAALFPSDCSDTFLHPACFPPSLLSLSDRLLSGRHSAVNRRVAGSSPAQGARRSSHNWPSPFDGGARSQTTSRPPSQLPAYVVNEYPPDSALAARRRWLWGVHKETAHAPPRPRTR